MKRKESEKAFLLLSKHLKQKGIKGEVGVVGGAAMVLAFDARASVVKLVDTLDLGSSAARCGGSSPSARTLLSRE